MNDTVRMILHGAGLKNMVTEVVPSLVLAVCALVLPRPLAGLSRLGKAVARRRWLAALLVGLSPVLIRLALLPVLPAQTPTYHDEFTYLLMSDTFSHGRLTNPPHPLWKHFESFHILMHPTYASAFPVAQGAVMAAGQVLTGRPRAGVLLSAGLMCAGFYWMLLAWVPPAWALLGAGLAVLRFGILSYWVNTYFGGPVPALGGALVLGALPRIQRGIRRRDALLMGIGLVMLANSRMYEGLVFSLAAGAVLLAWLFGRSGPPLPIAASRLAAPVVLVLLLAGAWMAYYNYRVTGNPAVLPYVAYRNANAFVPHFVWQPLRPRPVFLHKTTEEFYAGSELRRYEKARSLDPARLVWRIVRRIWQFYVGPLLTVPLLAAAVLWRSRKVRVLAVAAAAVVAAMSVEVWDLGHYAAPATAAILALIVMGLRVMNLWRWKGRRVGTGLVAALTLGFAATVGIRAAAGPQPWDREPWDRWDWTYAGLVERAAILEKLEATPGRDLVIVRYGPAHIVHHEWVYNRADIDAAPVVWAREMDPASNLRLLEYFHDRTAWLVEADLTPPRLTPYPAMDAPVVRQ